MKKIIVCDNMHPDVFKVLGECTEVEVIDATVMSREDMYTSLSDADVAITRSPTPVDDKFLKYAKNIKAIVRAGVGVDNVDIEASSKNGIIVMNVPTANTLAAVELTMTHMLCAARELPSINKQLKYDNVWDRKQWYGTELSGKKLGVIGFGNIGSRVATRAAAFGMEIVAYDPYIPSSKVLSHGFTYTKNFDDILACDFITIHTPKTKETIDIISYNEMKRMKNDIILINVARGGLINEDALYDNLKNGKIKFAGIDVWENEPCVNHRLFEFKNINVTPHLGANTRESQQRIAEQSADAAILAAKGISYPNALNLPIKENEISDIVRPYTQLIQKLSFLASQINSGVVTKIELKLGGEVNEYAESLDTFAIVGALKSQLGDGINYVNAKFLAEDKNIEIIVNEHKNLKSFENYVEISLTTQEKSISIAGTIFEGKIQRIVKIDEFTMDIKPKGKMIIFENSDKPGVIAHISTILSSKNINIADFRLGRGADGSALAVIIVDQSVSKELIAEIESLEFCHWASYVEI